MDNRAAKLALARKKLKDHQDKKHVMREEYNLSSEASLQDCIKQNESNGKNLDEFGCSNILSDKNEMLPKQSCHDQSADLNSMDVHVTEFSISNERVLELKVAELQFKLNQLDSIYRLEINKHSECKQEIKQIQNEFQTVKDKCMIAMEQVQLQESKINELNNNKITLLEENNNLSEQLELTKTILSSKETENLSLNSHLKQLQNELDVTKLQLQQLINGSGTNINYNESFSKQNEELSQKINSLEQQLKASQKEREQINLHYEHYAAELNEQLQSVLIKNEELTKEVQNLSNRESSLIEHISDMEIRLQNFQVKKLETAPEIGKTIDANDIQNKYTQAQEQLQVMNVRCEQLQNLLKDSDAKLNELQQVIQSQTSQENISMSKLTADITSDKIAAQRATEQNKKLKTSMQELEEAFVKMSQDKLELTEKLTAEKYLNRELTIKLAECEEKFKEMHIKLMAKDEEMLRLQNNCRELEKEKVKYLEELEKRKMTLMEAERFLSEQAREKKSTESETNGAGDLQRPCKDDNPLVQTDILDVKRNSNIDKEDAMFKLQERFLKIMSEVADLSDEKHRLEHIILQLQNETDTICEYVALYQQQRNLLKKRDEERSTQVKMFQIECEKLKNHLEELSGILFKFAEDQELATYFEVESRQKDMEKVSKLLLNLKSNYLVDPKKNNLELGNLYPCNCCSGNLMDV